MSESNGRQPILQSVDCSGTLRDSVTRALDALDTFTAKHTPDSGEATVEELAALSGQVRGAIDRLREIETAIIKQIVKAGYFPLNAATMLIPVTAVASAPPPPAPAGTH